MSRHRTAEIRRSCTGNCEFISRRDYRRLIYDWFVTPPWERQRARRVGRKILAEVLPFVTAEPWNRGPNWPSRPGDPASYRGSPLAQGLELGRYHVFIDPLDRSTLDRRALDQLVALKVWKYEHGGKNPDRLEALVPGLLASLPTDPYSGKPYGYKQVDPSTIKFPLLIENSTLAFRPDNSKGPLALIYSFGPDLKDDAARKTWGAGSTGNTSDLSFGDWIFAVP